MFTGRGYSRDMTNTETTPRFTIHHSTRGDWNVWDNKMNCRVTSGQYIASWATEDGAESAARVLNLRDSHGVGR
jgi:hypothetical protein